MKENLFISEWSFTKDYFLEIGKYCDFYSPFIDDIENIKEKIRCGGNTLIGWSAGAHIIAKDINQYYKKWDKIVFISPYLKFTENLSINAVNTLQKGLVKDFHKALSYFSLLTDVKYKHINLKFRDNLLEGLEFLKDSVVKNGCECDNAVVVYGCNDKIIKRKAILNFLTYFKNSKFMEIDQPHYISENIVLKFLSV